MIDRFKRFAARNKGAVISKIAFEAAARLYVRNSFRKVITSFVPERRPDQWVFMGGCYNSGTTILREILGWHSNIASLPREGVRFTNAFPNLEQDGWERMWHKNNHLIEMNEAHGDELARQAIRDWSPWWKKDARIFLEKSITHGTRFAWLDRHFENAKFIGVLRNGYCAAEGIRRRARPTGKALSEIGQDQYPIEMAGAQWVAANELLFRDSKKVRNFMLVRYEDFASDPLGKVTELFNFLGIPDTELKLLDDGTLRINGRIFKVSNMNSDSLARLSEADIEAINPVISPLMNEFGYPLLGGSNG